MSESSIAARSFDLEETPCPLCGAERYEVWRRAPDRLGVTPDVFTLVRCGACGLVYQRPRVSPATIGGFYPHDYAHYVAPTAQNRRRLTAGQRIVERKCDFVEQHVTRKGSVLEIGSANGDFLAGMRRRGWDVYGVEVSAAAVAVTANEHGIAAFCGELLDRPDDGRRFDAIVSWAVLPHIHNPVATMQRAAELLNPGGRLITLCANIASVPSSICGNSWGHLDLPRHYTMWSPSTLAALYRKAGVEVLEVVHHEQIYESMLVFNWIKPLLSLRASGPPGFVAKVIRWGIWHTNQFISWPITAGACLLRRGGIITMIGQRSAVAPST